MIDWLLKTVLNFKLNTNCRILCLWCWMPRLLRAWRFRGWVLMRPASVGFITRTRWLLTSSVRLELDLILIVFAKNERGYRYRLPLICLATTISGYAKVATWLKFGRVLWSLPKKAMINLEKKTGLPLA